MQWDEKQQLFFVGAAAGGGVSDRHVRGNAAAAGVSAGAPGGVCVG